MTEPGAVPTVGIVGGTGPAGSALAARLAHAGLAVRLGSRDPAKAAHVRDELAERWGEVMAALSPVSNDEAAGAEVVVLATAADSLVDTARQLAPALAGRVVVCMGNRLAKGRRGLALVLPEGRSLAEAVAAVAPEARVTGAFQNLPAAGLGDLSLPLDADVVVCGDDAGAVRTTLALVDRIAGLRALDGGPLANAAAIEGFTAVLININRARRDEHSVRVVSLHPETTTTAGSAT